MKFTFVSYVYKGTLTPDIRLDPKEILCAPSIATYDHRKLANNRRSGGTSALRSDHAQ